MRKNKEMLKKLWKKVEKNRNLWKQAVENHQTEIARSYSEQIGKLYDLMEMYGA